MENIMNAEYLADIRDFISTFKNSAEPINFFRPITLRPVELASLLEKLEGIYDEPKLPLKKNVVLIGSKVVILDMFDYTEMSLIISLPDDSDPSKGKISVLSPLGSSLLGRERGETFAIFYGNRMNRFRITSIDQQP
jgi:transcription elongation GreA/GreB family factor